MSGRHRLSIGRVARYGDTSPSVTADWSQLRSSPKTTMVGCGCGRMRESRFRRLFCIAAGSGCWTLSDTAGMR
jgi:hypothetical protein